MNKVAVRSLFRFARLAYGAFYGIIKAKLVEKSALLINNNR